MDTSRLKALAGMHTSPEMAQLERQLNEVVALPDDMSLDDAISRLDACKRALAIVNKMTDPADKKKWMRATFVNLNKVRGAVQRILAKMDAAASVTDDAGIATRLTQQRPTVASGVQ